jgi:hypothetical protein
MPKFLTREEEAAREEKELVKQFTAGAYTRPLFSST